MENVSAKYEYYPNINLFNRVIKEWSSKEILFGGIFHTHYADETYLSDADIYYIEKILKAMPEELNLLYFPLLLIEKILKAMPEELNLLYFPLLLIPSKRFVPFEAKIDRNGNISIAKDNLLIIH